MYSLNGAAKATGKSTSTIDNALKKGTVSGVKNEKGQWEIDPAELHRVYPPISEERDDRISEVEHSNDIETLFRIKELELKLEAALERAKTAENDRDAWRNQAQTLLLPEVRPQKKSWFRGWLGKRDRDTELPNRGNSQEALG